MEEIWRDIKGYEGRYQVSNLGKVKSVYTNKIMLVEVDKGGYERLSLYDGEKYSHFLVHRLVAQTFIPNLGNKPQINHIDGNKRNNSITNLEWCTASENQLHAFRTGLSKPKRGVTSVTAIFDNDDINWIRSNYIKGDKEFGMNAIARKYNTGTTTIWHIIHNDTYKEK